MPNNQSFSVHGTVAYWEKRWKYIVVLGCYLYIKGFLYYQGRLTLIGKYSLISFLTYVLFKLIQGMRRFYSDPYMRALANIRYLQKVKFKDYLESKEHLRLLNDINVDFEYLPAVYQQKKYVVFPKQWDSMETDNIAASISWLMTKTLAPVMLFPGYLFNSFFSSLQTAGREVLISEGGQRMKIRTVNGMELDTIFFDARVNRRTSDKLIILSEGNCSFYETRDLSSLYLEGFSCIGWNMPGYGCSMGVPNADTIAESIDAVVEYAVNFLRFPEKNIVLYGWSLGGFPASTVCAKEKSGIKRVIFDACFDEIIPLANSLLPPYLHSIASNTINRYYDMDLARNIKNYGGCPLFVIRIEDEIVTTGKIGARRISDNRTAHLASKYILYRYQRYFDIMSEYSLLNEFDKMSREFISFPYITENDETEKVIKLIGVCDSYAELNALQKTLMWNMVKRHCLFLHLSHNAKIDLPMVVNEAIKRIPPQ